MGKRTPNHLHKYKKTNIGVDGKKFLVFKCMRPACNHYIRVDLAEGKLCECNRCGEPMILTKTAMQLTKPHCTTCVRRKKTADVEAISEFLAGTKI